MAKHPGKRGKKGKGGRARPGRLSGAPPARRLGGAAFIAIVAAYVALRLPGIGVPLDRDEGVFGYMGQLILDGGLPYRDAVDHKPPVSFYINALALCFVPPTERGIHAFLLIYNFLTLVCIFFLGKVYFRSVSTGLWCAFAYGVFSASPAIQGFTASTEMWLLLPLALSLLLAVTGVRRRSALLLVLSGAAGAAACWTKPTAFTSVLFTFLYVARESFRGRHDTGVSPARPLLSWVLGGLAFSALPALYFYLCGIWSEFVYWSFLHNLSYAARNPLGESLAVVRAHGWEIVRGDFLILGAGVAAGVHALARRRGEGWFLLGFLLLSLLGTIPGFAYRHYFAQLAPAAAVAGGCGLASAVQACRTARGRLAATVACGFLAVLVPVIVNRHYFLEKEPGRISRYYFGFSPFPESRSLAEYVAQTTAADDRVLVIGSEPQILFYARRRSACSFPIFYPLMASYPRYREFQERVWEEVRTNRPKVALDMVNIPASLLWDGKADLGIWNRLHGMLRDEYVVERAMLIAGPRGDWVDVGDGRLRQGVPVVYIFRRKN